jgi:hypothetical protein
VARFSNRILGVSDSDHPKRARTTEKLTVWLPPEQIAWLKEKGASARIRALVTEAMNLDRLAESVAGLKHRE